MKKKIIYEIKGLYRDSFRITVALNFGEGKETLCIVGSMRGNRGFSSCTAVRSLCKRNSNN